MQVLPLFVRLEGRPVILAGDGDAASAKRRLLERAGAKVVGEIADAALAIVAIDDEAEAHVTVARLKARGILVNAVDRPALCDFTLPALIDRAPVLIAIGTGGASAGLAKALRQRLETLLPQSLGALATALKEARGRIRTNWPAPDMRRHAIDDALSPDGPLDLLVEHDAQAVERWLGQGSAPRAAAVHHLCLSSDDPDDLTLRQARLLGQADLVVHSSEVAPAILHRIRADAARLVGSCPPEPIPQGLTLILTREGAA